MITNRHDGCLFEQWEQLVSMKQKQTISLEQLITNPKPLKLLILHSPFPLALDPLKECINLIKLDVSGNNLQTIPYLGELTHLRFLFLHNNKLDFQSLRGVFTQPSSTVRSPLASGIVWATFWGNRNCFYARHFLVNNTAVIAVDKNIVVEEERSEGMQRMTEPFSQETALDFPLVKVEAKGFSEEEYIRMFYTELMILRGRYRSVNPVLQIQRLFRGGIVRLKMKRDKEKMQKEQDKIRKIVRHWFNFAKNQIRLRQITRKRKIQYLTGDLKLYKRHIIDLKMISLARAAKLKIKQKNSTRKQEIIIRNAFRRNYESFKLLFSQTKFWRYNKIYINSEDALIFQNIILPQLRIKSPNHNMELKFQREVLGITLPYPSVGLSPYINIMYPGIKAIMIKKRSKDELPRKKIFGFVPIKPVDRVCHIDSQSRKKSNELYEKFGRMEKYEFDSLMVLEGSETALKDLCRTVNYYNKGLLDKKDRRVCIVPEMIIHRITASTVVQKLWRGYSIRKKIKAEVFELIKASRAATRIQRWFRKLPFIHRRNFMILIRRALRRYLDCRIVIPMDVYLKMRQVAQEKRIRFIEQKADVVYHPDYNTLNIQWPKQFHGPDTDTILACRQIEKPLFSSTFQKDLLGQAFTIHSEGLKGDIYHLIHTNTKCKIIENAHKNKFLIVECPSMKDLKIRVFGLLLLTYNFWHKNQQAVFSSSQLESHRHVIASRMSWVNKRIENNNSIWMFCDNGRPYFLNRVASLNYRIVKQPVLIYLKERKNSFPFKVLDTLNFIFNGSINLFNVQQPEFIEDRQRLPTEQEKNQFSNIEATKHQISMNELFDGWMLRENSFEKQDIMDSNNKESQYRAMTSHVNNKKSLEKLIMKRKMNKTVKDNGRKLGSDLRTQYKTEQSAPQLIKSSKRPQRMHTHSTSFKFSEGKKINIKEHSKSSKQQQKFTANFVSLSNFISKQSQLSHIRQHRRKIYSQVAEATSLNRQKAVQSREKYKTDMLSRDKLLKEANKEHHQEMNAQKKPISRPRTREPKKIDPTRNKIHVVFPEECFPLLPNLN